MARYVLGPSLGSLTVTVQPTPTDPIPATPPVLADQVPTVASVDEKQVQLSWAAPADSHQYPTEVRVYLAPVGSPLPADADGWVASAFPLQATPFTAPTAEATIPAPVPAVQPGDYLGQVVLGFAS